MHTITNEQVQEAVGIYNDMVNLFNNETDEQVKNDLTTVMVTVEQILAVLGIDIGQQITAAVLSDTVTV